MCRGEHNIVIDELDNRKALRLIISYVVAVRSKISF